MKHTKQLVKKTESETPTFWDPFQEISDMSSALTGHWIGLPFLGHHHHHHHVHVPDVVGGRQWLPEVSVKETEKEIILSADLPGMNKKGLKVEVTDGILTLSGERTERKQSKDKGCVSEEQCCGSFQRSFSLPEDVKAKDVKASYKDGLLRVCLPRTKETKETSRKIEIS
ncbi:MAG: Hsp20/alpha crystallin family protein [Elusimicrobia bacterium]|nr:Hsp20/alpha crystallin family protein [Elusimicrobiota bacterium]